VLAYNLETLLAEKIETIISRGITNTRMRDFYDIYILSKLQANKIDQNLLIKAISETVSKRGKESIFENKELVITEVKESRFMQDLWTRYQNNYDYAKDVTWGEVIKAVEITLKILI
jgi:predicted nucleotidyltransferase component of viral defense system